MPKVTVITVTAEERTALEKSAKYGLSPSFRLRCQAILLKTDKRTSLAVAKQLGCCEMSVNDWLKRYQEQGLAGLQVKKGRGRKSILRQETDLVAVRRAVQDSRQRISHARAELEQELGKEFSTLTLKRFLKKTVAATNEFGEA
jgi:transposase